MRLREHLRSALVVACLACSCSTGQRIRRLDLPGVVLWAWERPEDLGFLDPQRAGVAFLAGTAFIATNGSVLFRMRTETLKLPLQAAVLPVVRIESALAHAPAQTAPLLSGVQRIANLPGVRGVQIDFDARSSERAFYRTLLAALQMHVSKPIGITALASWCEGDRWLDREPVAEAVPMFFRMGRGESRDMNVKSSVCRSSIGLSTDEPWPAKRPAGIERIYLFSPRAWTNKEYSRSIERVENWK